MKKLTAKQQEKITMMQDYLKTDIGEGGLMLNDCYFTDIWNVKKIWVTGLGINIIGTTVQCWKKRDFLLPNEINNLFSAAKRGDEDFKEFINNN